LPAITIGRLHRADGLQVSVVHPTPKAAGYSATVRSGTVGEVAVGAVMGRRLNAESTLILHLRSCVDLGFLFLATEVRKRSVLAPSRHSR
jgi:hypothetical protein